MDIRPATVLDARGIRRVHEAAFPTSAEANLVERIENDGDAAVSLIAEEDGAIVGHILLSHMDVVASGRAISAMGLGPVAVLPVAQGRGIGSALIKAALAEARRCGAEMIFLLGEPAFYQRFGFSAATAAPFESPYAGPHFQAVELTGNIERPAAGRASYPPAFNELT